MEYQEAMRALETDPEFAKLTYKDQVSTRAQIASSYLNEDSEFLALNAPDRGWVLESLSYAPPVYENKEKYDIDTQTFVQGIDEDRKSMGDAIAANRWWEATKDRQKTLRMIGYELPVIKEKFKEEMSAVEGFMEWGYNTMLDTLGALPVIGLPKEEREQMKEEMYAFNRDEKKFAEYVDYYLSQDKRTANDLLIGKQVAALSGIAVDLALYGKLLGTPTSPTGPLGFAVKAVDDGLSKITPWLGRAAGQTTHWVMGGLIGVGREAVKSIVNDATQTPEGALTIHNAARNFSEYVVGDIALFSIGAGLKSIGKGLTFATISAHNKPTVVSDVAEVLYRAMSSQDIPVETIGRLPDPLQKILRYDEAVYKTLNDVERMSDVDRFKVVADNFGWMLEEGEKGVTLTNKLGELPEKGFSTMEDAQKWFVKEVTGVLEVPKPTLKGPNDLPLQTPLRIREVITKAGGGDLSGNVNVLSQIIAPVKGEFSPQGVKGFVEGYLSSKGQLIRATVDELPTSLKVKVKDVEFEVPKRITTGTEEREVITSMVEKLQGVEGGKVDPEVTQKVLSEYLESVKGSRSYTPGWVEQAAETIGAKVSNEGGGWQLMRPDGSTMSYSKYADVADDLVRLTTDEGTIKRTLLVEHGLILKGSPEKGFELRQVKSGDTAYVESFKSIDEFKDRYPHLMPGIDSKLGPELTIADDGLIEMKYYGKVLTGPRDKILKELRNFREGDAIFNKVKVDTEVNFDRVKRTYEVSAPGMSMRSEFDSLKKAKAFLRKMEDPYEKMIYQSYRKGYRIHADENGYFFYDATGNRFTGRSVEEVNALLEKVPVPEYAPELSGFDEALRGMKQTIDEDVIPKEFVAKATHFPKQKAPVSVSNAWLVNNFWRPADAQLAALVKKGFPEEFYTSFKKMQEALSFGEAKDYEMHKVVNGIFVDPLTKRGIKEKTREVLQDIFLKGSKEWESELIARKLPKQYKDVLQNIQTFYDNWYNYMDVDEPFIQRYLPHLRDYFANPTNKILADGNMHQQLRMIYGKQSLPSTLDSFFTHSRVSAVYDLALERDPLEVMRKIVTMGNRQKYVGPMFKEMRAFISKAGAKHVDPLALNRLTNFLDEVIGVPSTNSEAAVQRISDSVFRKMKIAGKPIARDLMSLLTGWGYGVTMSFRPFTAARNLLQIWQAGYRIGNGFLEQAMDILGNDVKGTLFERLKLKGVIAHSDLPLPGGVHIKDADWIGKFNKKGLAAFSTVDDFTRAVAYTGSELSFDSAFKRLQSKALDWKGFVHESGLYNLKDLDQKRIASLIQQGNIASAKDVFSTILTSETMFDYRAGMGTYVTKGVVGKLFGQMGHYSTFFINNIVNTLGRGNIAERAVNVGRFLVNSTAIYLAADKVLGLRGDSFLPWAPAIFTGGPMYALGNEMLASFNPTWMGQMQRAKTFGIKTKDGMPYIDWGSFAQSSVARMLIPSQLRSLYYASQTFNEGDYYSTFLNLTSAPVNIDNAFWNQ